MAPTMRQMKSYLSKLNKKGTSWVGEDQLGLLPEATQEKYRAKQGGCKCFVARKTRPPHSPLPPRSFLCSDQIRVLHGFSIWEGDKLTRITPKTTAKQLENCIIYASCASLNGPAYYLVMSGEWEVDYPLLHKQPLRLTGIKKVRIDVHDRFRGGYVCSAQRAED